MRSGEVISAGSAWAYMIPTDAPEGDGTFTWDKTTIVVAEVTGGGGAGLGYTYADASVAPLFAKTLEAVVVNRDAMDVLGAWGAMQRQVRNIGRSGLAAYGISAVDAALWDLKAKLLEMPLASLLGRTRDTIPIYGSGRFTTYSDRQLRDQLSRWVEHDACRAVKMKIGAHPGQDLARVAVAKAAIGEAELFLDANGAFGPREMLLYGCAFAESADVRWFEGTVSSDDLSGLRFEREGAPSLHLRAACASPRFRHLEWFHDHARIERMLFDGAPLPKDGAIRPNLARPGFGLTFKCQDTDRYAN